MSEKWERLMNSGGKAMAHRQYASAREEFNKALKIAERYGDDLERFENLTALACAHASEKQHQEAEKLFLRAIELCRKKIGRYCEATTMCSLANVYREIKEIAKCRSLALEGLTIFETEVCEEPAVMLLPLTTLAEISIDAGEWDNAHHYLRKCNRVADADPSSQSLAFRPKIRDLEKRYSNASEARYVEGVFSPQIQAAPALGK
jgi:tetratricopeptide (TPR) repeat protein